MFKVSYILDWATVGALVAYYAVIGRNIEPFHRQFLATDPRISHPYGKEQVPTLVLIVLVIGSPLIVLAVLSYMKFRSQRKYIELTLVAFMMSLSINGVVVDFLKKAVANHRPDFLSRCVPDLTAIELNGLMSVSSCTSPYGHAVVLEGLRSTPSGHASLSFGGLLFVSLFVFHHFKINKMHLKILAGLLVILATYISLTRTQDYRHHYLDIILGALVGSLISYYTFSYYNKQILPESLLPA